jgi:hypothetical protein
MAKKIKYLIIENSPVVYEVAKKPLFPLQGGRGVKLLFVRKINPERA